MPRRTNPFQEMIFQVEQQLADGTRVEQSRLLNDAVSGSREVDVVLESTVGGYAVIVSIECCDRGRPADVSWVEQQCKKHETLPTSLLVLVSRSGFTSTASARAAHEGVLHLHVDDARQVDWCAVVGQLETVRLFWFDAVTGVRVFYDGDEGDGHLVSHDAKLQSACGEFSTSARGVVDAVFSKPQLRAATVDKASVGERGGWLAYLPLKPGTVCVTPESERAVRAAEVVLISELRKTSFTLQGFSMRRSRGHEIQVGHGEARGDFGKAWLTVVESRDGAPKVSVTVERPTGVRESDSLTGGRRSLRPASDETMRALLGGSTGPPGHRHSSHRSRSP